MNTNVKNDLLTELSKEPKIASESERIFKTNKNVRPYKKGGKIYKHRMFK